MFPAANSWAEKTLTVLPNGLGTSVDLTVPLGSPNEPALAALYEVTLRTLSATASGVSDEEIEGQSKRQMSPSNRHLSMSTLLVGAGDVESLMIITP